MRVSASPSRQVCRFGVFEVSFELGELRKNGLRLKLQDQPFRVLRILIEHRGEPVTREFLRQQLWPDGTFVDFEHGLNTAIKKIRDTLGDDPNHPHYIETLPRKGYRFLAALDENEPVPVVRENRAVAPKRRRISLLFLPAACALGFATFALLELRAPPSIRIEGTQQLTFSEDLSPYSTVETDGRRVFYFKYSDSRLYSVPVHGGEASSVETHLDAPVMLHLSPDGSTLLVRELSDSDGDNAGQVWILPTNGGAARPLADIFARAAAFFVDGKSIAYSRGRKVFITDAAGRTSRLLFDTDGEVTWLRYSPDGHRIRFALHDPATERSRIWEIPSDGREQARPVKLGDLPNADFGVWLRDSRYFMFRVSRDLRRDYWIANDRFLLRAAKPVLFGGGGPDSLAAVGSPLENLVLTVQYERSARSFRFDVAKKQLSPMLPGASVLNPAVSRDGSWMAVVQSQNEQRILWRVNSEGNEWRQLADSKMFVHHAHISPDGKRVAFMAKEVNGPWVIYWIAAEGGALHKVETNVENTADPNWMPDNDSILYGQPPRYYAAPEIGRTISIVNLTTNSNETIAGSEGWFSPRISNDGRKFLALSINERKLGVYEFSTRRWRVLLERPNQHLRVPSWSRDGKWAYINVVGGGFRNALMRVNVEDASVERVLALHEAIPYPDCWGWEVSPEDKILISCIRPNADLYAMKYE